jgi:hypothetical protein
MTTQEEQTQTSMIREEMINCLRSDKSEVFCHKQMKIKCERTFGEYGCPAIDESDIPSKRFLRYSGEEN